MKKDKEKKKKRLKRASPSPAPVEVVSAGESVQPTAPEAPLVYFCAWRAANGKSGFMGVTGWEMPPLWGDQSAVSGITDMMLSQSLKDLCADGLLHRQQYQEIPPKVEYSLTPSGKTLLPALNALCEWERQMELSNHS